LFFDKEVEHLGVLRVNSLARLQSDVPAKDFLQNNRVVLHIGPPFLGITYTRSAHLKGGPKNLHSKGQPDEVS
jgi:hypothetical protein